MLKPIISVLCADPSATLLNLAIQPVSGGSGEGLGLYRVCGQAQAQGQITPWSVVLKILSPATSGTGVEDWNYWRREAHVYASGLLTTWPGPLRTPRCYGVQDQPDGSCWLWLEDLGPVATAPWDTDRVWRAAHHLGQSNGHYLTSHPLPDEPWLNRTFLPQWLDRAPGMAQLAAALTHPLVRRLYPDDVLAGYQRLWAVRTGLLTKLAAFPQTFCHLDAFSANLLPRRTAGDAEALVAIDWAYAGIDAIGAELAPLIFARVTLLERVELAVAKAQAAAAVDGYLAGLTAVGWRGASEQVRFGYLATALLRYGVGMVPVSIKIVTDPHIHDWAAAAYGAPIEEMIAYWVAVARWRVELMTELLDL